MNLRSTHRFTMGLILTSTVSLAVGYFVPVGTIRPSFGWPLVNSLMMYLSPDGMAPQTKSLLEGIWAFFEDKQYLVGSILLTFTVLFPVAKLSMLAVLCATYPQSGTHSLSRWTKTRTKCRKFLAITGHWSMLDVFVVAVVVACFAKFPLGTRIVPEPGLLFFALSIVLSIFAVQLVSKLETFHSEV